MHSFAVVQKMGSIIERYSYLNKPVSSYFSPCIETTVRQDGIITKNSRYIYGLVSGVNENVRLYDIDNSFGYPDTLTTYKDYNAKGEPIVIQKKGMPVSRLFWSDRGKLLGLVTTASSEDVTFTSGAANSETLKIGNISCFNVENTNACVIKYDNFGLVESITKSPGITTYYEYDAAGRLIAVRDQNKKILSTHSYNFQEQE